MNVNFWGIGFYFAEEIGLFLAVIAVFLNFFGTDICRVEVAVAIFALDDFVMFFA